MRAPWALVAGVCAGLAAPAAAEDAPRLDHRGALGVILGAGVSFQETVLKYGVAEEGRSPLFQAEVTFPLGAQGNEWTLAVGTALNTPLTVAVAGGIRAYFGEETWKTFVTVEGTLHVTPAVTAGPRPEQPPGRAPYLASNGTSRRWPGPSYRWRPRRRRGRASASGPPPSLAFNSALTFSSEKG